MDDYNADKLRINRMRRLSKGDSSDEEDSQTAGVFKYTIAESPDNRESGTPRVKKNGSPRRLFRSRLPYVSANGGISKPRPFIRSVPLDKTNVRSMELAKLQGALADKDVEIAVIRQENVNLRQKLADMEANQAAMKEQILEIAGKEYHRQYSEKHKQKVALLKASYEEKYSQRITELEELVLQERAEKEKLVELYDEYVQLESARAKRLERARNVVEVTK